MSNFIRILLIISILIGLAGCGSKPQPYQPNKQKFSYQQRQKIISTALKYRGSPYRYGGIDSKGFDCSGLIYRVYLNSINYNLPRTVKKQFNASYAIPMSHATTGDIVFFSIKSNEPDHAGIILDRGRFIHASSSKGVIVSRLANAYYRQKFLCARRLK